MKIDWDKVTSAQLVKMLEIAIEVEKSRTSRRLRHHQRAVVTEHDRRVREHH